MLWFTPVFMILQKGPHRVSLLIILIIFAVLLMFAVYLKRKSAAYQTRKKKRQKTGMAAFLESDELVIISACLVLIIVGLATTSLSGNEKLKKERLDEELKWQYSIAEEIGIRLSRALPGQTDIIIIDRLSGTNDAQYKDARTEGLKAGLGDKMGALRLEPFQINRYSEEHEQDATLEFIVKNADLERFFESQPNAKALVSFIGLPFDYPDSPIAKRASEGELFIAAQTSSVYTLKSSILNNALAVVIVPKSIYVTPQDDIYEEENPYKVEYRYLVITPENAEELAAQNRRMFKYEVSE